MPEKIFIGDAMKRLRHAQHLSQADLARLTGLRQGFISELESNKKEPGASTLVKLSRALSVSVDEILDLSHEVDLRSDPEKTS